MFTKTYIAVRTKERRVLTDEQVQQLPYVSPDNPNFNEWRIRKRSANRFLKYLSHKKNIHRILEIGCGNGWFSNLIANKFPSISVIGLDINDFELEQANNTFQRENLTFVYGDIFELNSNVFEHEFDFVVFNASIQYFNDFDKVISKVKSFLKPNGEIHIIDSPFYNERNIITAKQRTFDYYNKLGFPEMAKNYFHHRIDNVVDFEVLYHPKKIGLSRIFKGIDSPFMWLKSK